MSYQVQIVADSISPSGARITTFQLRFPRFLLAEFNTHRAFSRNARSSRAVPVMKSIREVAENPVVPIFWGANRSGMQATEELDLDSQLAAQGEWILACKDALGRALALNDTGVHKQIVNRLIEPYLWTDVVVTSTDYNNFFCLRCHESAQPEMQVLAVRMARAYRDSVPASLRPPEWHLPYLSAEESEDLSGESRVVLSVARCARVSYMRFDGKNPDFDKDIKLHDQLRDDGHWSPFEHQAQCVPDPDYRSGNFRGWDQYRQRLAKSVHAEFDFATLDRFEGRDFIV